MSETTAPAVQTAHCGCGCGEDLNPKSSFRQGHDQRLVSKVASMIVDDGGDLRHYPFMAEWSGMEDFQLADLGNDRDIQDQIDRVTAAVGRRFSDALATKTNAACHRAWELAGKKTALQAERAAKKAAVANRKPAAKVAKPTPKAKAAKKTTVDEIQDQLVGLDASTETGFAGAAPKLYLGAQVNAKVGRWVKEAIVHGMNQAGKVTAVKYRDARGNEKTTDKFTLVD